MRTNRFENDPDFIVAQKLMSISNDIDYKQLLNIYNKDGDKFIGIYGSRGNDRPLDYLINELSTYLRRNTRYYDSGVYLNINNDVLLHTLAISENEKHISYNFYTPDMVNHKDISFFIASIVGSDCLYDGVIIRKVFLCSKLLNVFCNRISYTKKYHFQSDTDGTKYCIPASAIMPSMFSTLKSLTADFSDTPSSFVKCIYNYCHKILGVTTTGNLNNLINDELNKIILETFNGKLLNLLLKDINQTLIINGRRYYEFSNYEINMFTLNVIFIIIFKYINYEFEYSNLDNIISDFILYNRDRLIYIDGMNTNKWM